MNNQFLQESILEISSEKNKKLTEEDFMTNNQVINENLNNTENSDFYSIQFKSKEKSKSYFIADSEIKDKSTFLIENNEKNLIDTSTIRSICQDIVEKQDLNPYESRNYLENNNSNIFSIIPKFNENVNSIKQHDKSISSSDNFVEINFSPNGQIINNINNKTSNFFQDKNSKQASMKESIKNKSQIYGNFNLSNKMEDQKSKILEKSLKSRVSINDSQNNEDIKIYEDCEDIIINNTKKSNATGKFKNENSDLDQLVDNDHYNQSKESDFTKVSNDDHFNKEELDKQIESERENYLARKLDEIKEKIIISDDNIICSKCFNEINLEELLNNENCKICVEKGIENNKNNEVNLEKKFKNILEAENIEVHLKEKFFSNEEKESSKDEEIRAGFYNEDSDADYVSSESEDEKLKESKYKFIIDKEHLESTRRKRRKSKTIEEIEEFINKKKWHSGKNNNIMNIFNIKKNKIGNQKDSEYLVNYIKNKYTQNNIKEENVRKNSHEKEFFDIEENTHNQEENIKKGKDKNAYDESEILDYSSSNRKSKNKESEFTFNNQTAKINNINNLNLGNSKNKKFEWLNDSHKEKGIKTAADSNYQSKLKSFLDPLNLPESVKNSSMNSKISFDIYPKSTKEIATLYFKKYKKENDDKLLKKILKIAKRKELSDRKKFGLVDENLDSISHVKSESIKNIFKKIRRDKIRKLKNKKANNENDSRSINESTESNVDNNTNEKTSSLHQRKKNSMNIKNNHRIKEEVQRKLYASAKETDEVVRNKFGFCSCCCRDKNENTKNNCIIY